MRGGRVWGGGAGAAWEGRRASSRRRKQVGTEKEGSGEGRGRRDRRGGGSRRRAQARARARRGRRRRRTRRAGRQSLGSLVVRGGQEGGQLPVEERKGKGKGGQGGGEQRSKVRSRSEGSPPQRLELWATGLPRKTTPKWLHDTFQGLSEFVLAPSRTGRPTARLVFQNQ